MTPFARTALAAGVAAVFASAGDCGAVTLSQDGTGQALIFPYYTVQAPQQGSSFNTYVSVVNHTGRVKAVRVRFREARNSRGVMDINVFLSPNDVWTAAVVPHTSAPGTPARVLSQDRSCSSPFLGVTGFELGVQFSNLPYSGANNDGAGTGLDRTREGFVEIIEMGTLTGTWASAVTHNSAGTPFNCGILTGGTLPQMEPPTGGLSGTLTLINVANGMDFGVSAEALADLATQPFYRPATDPYPDFNAAEINPISIVSANGSLYRSTWPRPVDAVSAVLMRSDWIAEYVLDIATASLTDVVLTFPTRQFYTNIGIASPPFSARASWDALCTGGEPVRFTVHNREQRREVLDPGCGFLCPPSHHFDTLCAASTAISPLSGAAHMPTGTTSSVFGAVSTFRRGFGSQFVNGWLSTAPTASQPLTSLANSTRTEIRTGATAGGGHAFSGLPVVGFWARTFVNGRLACGTTSCQGNYGGAFPLTYRRAITP